jgi:ribonuclease R
MGHKHSEKKKDKKKSGSGQTFKGKLEITRSGMGFVIIDDLEQDILVRPSDFNTALHGDTVLVKILNSSAKSRRMQGEVLEVITRKQNEFLGHIELSESFAFFIPESEKPMPDIFIPLNDLKGAKDKSRVIVRIVEWEKNKKPKGTVIELMDNESENDRAMKEILAENGFPLIFPDAVIEASQRLPDIIGASEIELRKDLRKLLTFTIDPADAKDFDDAISFRVLANGNYEIGVHIADVSHYVEPETELDQ